jgi:hypothetical protein
VVDPRGGFDDQIDGVGQLLSGLLIQPEIRLTLVAEASRASHSSAKTPKEAGRAGQQHGADVRARARQRRTGGECLLIDELVQLEIPGMHLRCIATMHRRERRPFRPGPPLGLDELGDPLQAGGRG